MNIPGLLVEYLVIGSSALVWLFPLLDIQFFAKESLSFEKAAALAPALYVLGMFVDFLAFVLVTAVPSKAKSLKARVRSRLQKKFHTADGSTTLPLVGGGRSTMISVALQLQAPGLLKELELRSSRDRIARSTVVNLLLLALVLASRRDNFLLASAAVFAALICVAMWMAHEYNTCRFEHHAYDAAVRSGTTHREDAP